MAEKLRKVEKFEELRAGMIVVCKGCIHCGGDHRGLIINLGPAAFDCGPLEPAWDLIPVAPCGSDAISASEAESGDLYIVEDEDTKTTEATKRLERVK